MENFKDLTYENLAADDRMDYARISKLNFTSSMSDCDRRFISGLISRFKPLNIIEMGVYRGGGSLVILNALTDLPESRLISVDFDSGEAVGSECTEKCQNPGQWKLYKGRDISQIIKRIEKEGGGRKFDFAVIDTAHYHPIESLNFLCVLPYLTEEAVVVLHDVSLFSTYLHPRARRYEPFSNFPKICFAPYLLYSTVVGDKLSVPTGYYNGRDSWWNSAYPNICAIQLNSDTRKYITNVFLNLQFPWAFVPKYLHSVDLFIRLHYEQKHYEMFREAAAANTLLASKEFNFKEYTVGDYPFDLKKTNIFFGLSKSIRSWLVNDNYSLPVFPDEIWDNNADEIVQSIPRLSQFFCISKPDYTREDKNINIFITARLSESIQEIRDALESNGFRNVYVFEMFFHI